jgi:hypothetical protein
MKPKIKSWNTHLINDTTNYTARFPDNTEFFAQTGVSIKELVRTGRPSSRASKGWKSRQLLFAVHPKSTWTTKVDELHKWFDPHDPALGQFVIQDEDASNREWYVDADVEDEPLAEPGRDGVQIKLRVYDTLWKSVLQNSDIWTITASGQTHDLTLLGNRYVRPTFQFKATSLKTTGWQFKNYRCWRNPNSVGQAKRLQDITNDAWDTAALINYTTISNLVNHVGGYTSGALSLAIDTPVGGGLQVFSGMCYCARTGEQIKYTSISAGVMTIPSDGRGWGGTTAAALLDNDVLSFSHLAADGRDIRVFVNNVSVPRWLKGMNTTTTQVFVNLDWEPEIALNLGVAIAGSGAITEVTFTMVSTGALKELRKKEIKQFAFGSEIFIATDIDTANLKALGVTRAALGSSMASHAPLDNGYWVQHRIEISTGNPALTAPTQDESAAPLQDLDNTTNASPKFLIFYDKSGLRSGIWSPAVKKGIASYVYLGPHNTDADPATELGLTGAAYELNGGTRGDSYEIVAEFYDMAGITTVSMNGDKMRTSTDWSTKSALQKSTDGINWVQVWSEATPSAANAWEAWSHAAASLTTPNSHIRLYHQGSIKGIKGNLHSFELQTVTLVLNSTTIPQLVFASTEISNQYELACTITNNDTGDFIKIAGLIDLNETLEVDTETKTVTYLKDDSNCFPMLDVDIRGEWLPLDPAVVADNINTIQFDDTGTAGLTLTTKWYDRMAG